MAQHRNAAHRRQARAALVALLLSFALSGCGGSGTSGGSSPAGGSTASLTGSSTGAASSSGVVIVHVAVVHQGAATLAVAPVMIDGRGPYPFILDTGASTSAINDILATQLGLRSTGRTAQVSGVTATQKVQAVSVPHWSVGSFSLPAGSDLGALNFPMSQSGGAIAGLLGSDQLSRFGSITLDYRAQQLRFTP